MGGNAQPGGGGAGRVGRPYSGEDVRQFTREMRNQRDAAETLRNGLRQQRRDVTELNRLIDQMRALEQANAYNDPEALQRLRNSLLEGIKEFEFGLRRSLATNENAQPALGGSDAVPAAYRDLVSEYFKSLSKRPPKP
jgi:DNA-binding MurR/RpiR family transcriptional regulator